MSSHHRGKVVIGMMIGALVTAPLTGAPSAWAVLSDSRAQSATIPQPETGGTLARKKKPARGTLSVAVSGSGSYTVTGRGFRKTSSTSKAFKVKPGTYMVSAPSATVQSARVKVRKGKTARVNVTFPVPITQPPVTNPTPNPEPSVTPTPDPTPPPPPVTDTLPPAPVSGLVVTNKSATGISLSWLNPNDSDLASVIVRRASGPLAPSAPDGGTAIDTGAPLASSVADTGLSAYTEYSYAVFTQDIAGNVRVPAVTVTARTASVSGAVQLVSTDSTSTQSNDSSEGAAWSPDGTRVAFYSEASNLVPNDTNAASDLFVKTLATGAIERISTTSAGVQANGASDDRPAWSPDGTRIAFASQASNLVPNDTNGAGDIFVKTLSTGAITRISTDPQGDTGNAAGTRSLGPAWSPDGTRIAFYSALPALVPGDTNNTGDVFVKTLASGAIQRISTNSTGTQAQGSSPRYINSSTAWSHDGLQVAFESEATDLVSGDTNDSRDVFVKTLSTGVIERVSTDSSGTQANGDSHQPEFSPVDGTIAFRSEASNLVADDTNGDSDIFVKDLTSGSTQVVSKNAAGVQGNAASYGLRWSPDGTRIAFESWASNLVAGWPTGTVDIYVKTLSDGAVQRITVNAAGIDANSESGGPAWSPDGTAIAFHSDARNLVPGDANGTRDVFVKDIS